jgi:hypothetical protein
MFITIQPGTVIHAPDGRRFTTSMLIESTTTRITPPARNRTYFRYLGQEWWVASNDPGVNVRSGN